MQGATTLSERHVPKAYPKTQGMLSVIMIELKCSMFLHVAATLGLIALLVSDRTHFLVMIWTFDAEWTTAQLNTSLIPSAPLLLFSCKPGAKRTNAVS